MEASLCNYVEIETPVMTQVVFVGESVNRGLKFHEIKRSDVHLSHLHESVDYCDKGVEVGDTGDGVGF